MDGSCDKIMKVGQSGKNARDYLEDECGRWVTIAISPHAWPCNRKNNIGSDGKGPNGFAARPPASQQLHAGASTTLRS